MCLLHCGAGGGARAQVQGAAGGREKSDTEAAHQATRGRRTRRVQVD